MNGPTAPIDVLDKVPLPRWHWHGLTEAEVAIPHGIMENYILFALECTAVDNHQTGIRRCGPGVGARW